MTRTGGRNRRIFYRPAKIDRRNYTGEIPLENALFCLFFGVFFRQNDAFLRVSFMLFWNEKKGSWQELLAGSGGMTRGPRGHATFHSVSGGMRALLTAGHEDHFSFEARKGILMAGPGALANSFSCRRQRA